MTQRLDKIAVYGWALDSRRSFTYDLAQAFAKKTDEKVIPTFCGMCGPAESCGVYAFVKNSRFTRVAGMNGSPVNQGALCSKGQSAPQWVHSLTGRCIH